MKKYLIMFCVSLVLVSAIFIYFRFFFTYEQRNKFQRSVESVTGQNLVVTVFDMNGKTVKKWSGVQKLTSAEKDKGYVFFYTSDGKYVQLPNSVLYIAEEE
jgi:uncharacterized membrane protein